MTTGPKPYVVQPGDTLLSIALLHEVEPARIWDHEKNAELKQRRDPEILAPGEVIHVPAPEAPTLQVAPESTNRFRAKVPRVDLHLRFMGEAGPLAGERYALTGLREPVEGALDADGRLKVTVPVSARRLKIAFPERDVEHELQVGHLDPVERASGLRARLLHLGFLPTGHDSPDPFVFPTQESVRQTLMAFQKAFGLEPTGYYDPDTGDALTQAHGS